MQRLVVKDRLSNFYKKGLLAASISMVCSGAMAQSEDDSGIQDEVLIVTGSHIRQASGFESKSSVSMISREDIDVAGYTTVKDIARDSPVTSGTLLSDPTGDQTGTSYFNIRGLGIGSTLTLINGRRAGIASVSDGTGATYFDINTVPLSMVRRVDLLTDGASATYGADAVAGVANIVTRKGFEGFEMSAEFHDASNESVSIGFASGVATDNGTINLYGTHYRQTRNERKDFDWAVDRLNGGVEDYYTSRDLAVLNGGVNSSTGSPGSYVQAVFDDDAGGYVSSGGGRVADPDCYAAGGVPDGTLCRFNFFDQRSVIPEEDRTQLFAEIEMDLSDRVTFFGEASASNNVTKRTHGPQFFKNGLIAGGDEEYRPYIPGSHPFNFFVAAPTDEDPNAMEYRGPDSNGVWAGTDEADWASGALEAVDLVCLCRPLGNEFNGDRSPYPDWRVEVNAFRYMMGLDISMSDNWNLNLSYQASKYNQGTTASYEYKADLYNQLLLDGVFNPFGTRIAQTDLVSPKDGVSIAENSPELIDQIVGSINESRRATQETFEAIASGSAGSLPGGGIGLAVGYQFRGSSLDVVPDSARASGNGNDDLFESKLSGTQEVNAAFVEVLLPVTDSLEVQLAARYEDFGDDVTTTDPKLKARWQALDWFALRGVAGSSFQAPSISQQDQTISTAFVNDPCAANPNTNYSILTIEQGSADLEPQSADNVGFGFVLEPGSGFSLSLDYWSYDYTNLISSGASAQGIIDSDCDDGVANDPNVVRGGDGQILRVLSETSNIGAAETSGYDLNFVYDFYDGDIGSFTLKSAFTYVEKFEVQENEESEVFDAVGSRNSQNDFGPMPQLKGNASVRWVSENHSASVTYRYIDSYEEDRSGTEVDSFSTIDLQYSLTLDEFLGEETRLSFGVNNLLDQDPPNIANNRPGFDNFTHDPRGRDIYAKITQRF